MLHLLGAISSAGVSEQQVHWHFRVRVLLVATYEVERHAARFVLCSVAGQVRELFELGSLLDAFTIHSSRGEALPRPS